MKKYLLFTTVLLLYFGYSSCDRMECEDETYDIPAKYKAAVPYTGDETLTFVNDSGDTALLIGQGRTVLYDEEYISAEECDYQYNHQEDETTFKCSIPKIDIEIRLYQDMDRLTFFYISINEDGSYHFSSSSDNFFQNGDGDIDTMTVNNKLYENILHKNGTHHYYTKSDGIIRFDVDSTDTWSLIPN
ncbi:MAG: hypothetical protein JKY33_04500 [Bacteroidia bacterium]|nr:hypothetical protein [Bacteroidia bacterium]